MGGDLGNSMDFPFEPTSGELHDEHVHYSGGVIVMASVVDVPSVGIKPALVFRFGAPTGGFYPPVVLVCDGDQLANLVTLVRDAVGAARHAASAGGGS